MKILRGLTSTLVVLFLVAIALEGILLAGNVPAYLVPLPSRVLDLVVERWSFLLDHTLVTMTEALFGWLLGNISAYAFAALLVRYPRSESTGVSIAVALKATPIIALAPLFVIWFGNGMLGKVLMAALVCFFPMLINAITRLRNVEADALDYLRSLGTNQLQIFRFLRIPASLPYTFAAAKTSSTIAVVDAIVAELSGSDLGIGHILQVSVYDLETTLMFAAILFIAAFGILFYLIISLVEQAFIGRYHSLNVA